MQYSVRALLILTALVAALMVLPIAFSEIFRSFWFVIPALLVTLVAHGQPAQRTFAIGGLAAYVAMTLSTPRPNWTMIVWQLGVVAGSGGCCVVLERKLNDQQNRNLASTATPPSGDQDQPRSEIT